MAFWGQSQDFGQGKPVLKASDEKPAVHSSPKKKKLVLGQEPSSGNSRVSNINMALDSSMMSMANSRPSWALHSSPSSTGSPVVHPQTTCSISTFSREEGSQNKNPALGQTPLRSFTESCREDKRLSHQLDSKLFQQLLLECPEWDQLLNPTLKTVLQNFLKSQLPKNPREIMLGLRDPQSELRRQFEEVLHQLPSWEFLLEQSLKRILQEYRSSQDQQQGQMTQSSLPISQQWQQKQPGHGRQRLQKQPGHGGQKQQKQPGHGGQKQMPQTNQPLSQQWQQQQLPSKHSDQGGQWKQMLQVYLPTFQYQRQPRGQKPRRDQQEQGPQTCRPMLQQFVQHKQRQPGQGGDQGKVQQSYWPTSQQKQQQYQGQQPGQGGQQGQMLQVFLPTIQYHQQQLQRQQPGQGDQQGQVLQFYLRTCQGLQVCLPVFQSWQQLFKSQQPGMQRNQGQTLQTHQPTLQYQQSDQGRQLGQVLQAYLPTSQWQQQQQPQPQDQ